MRDFFSFVLEEVFVLKALRGLIRLHVTCNCGSYQKDPSKEVWRVQKLGANLVVLPCVTWLIEGYTMFWCTGGPMLFLRLDFHLVQLFFVCLPSLAVYLTAQYARYEIRRMEGELEVKKKAEEEAKEKELLLKAAEEQESKSDPELREVKARLGKLEEAIKEIVVTGSKKELDSTVTKKQDGDGTKQPPVASNSAPEDQTKKETRQGSGQQEGSGSVAITDASLQNQEATQDKGPER
ncbi:hypothetical protein AgCh_011176 [Apium graveolens]